ncbi:MAG: hypothetical protein ACYS99_13295, partial [Planctomycetota bacterium]
MRRTITTLLLLLVPAGPLLAQDWSQQVDSFERVLATRDAARWQRSLVTLGRHDHPAAVEYIARFYAAQREHDGEWQGSGGFLLGDPDETYSRLLRPARNLRSVRYMADRLDDESVGGLFATVLEGSSELHAVGDRLRARYRKALRSGETATTRRHFALLRGRLHVGDRGWVRTALATRAIPEPARLELLAAYPDYELWREVLERNE